MPPVTQRQRDEAAGSECFLDHGSWTTAGMETPRPFGKARWHSASKRSLARPFRPPNLLLEIYP